MERLVRKFDNGKGKKPEDDVFDELSTSTLNQYLKELMPGLTAKVDKPHTLNPKPSYIKELMPGLTAKVDKP